jgi:hypothetical protein
MAKRFLMIAALGIGLAVIGTSLLLRTDEASCQSNCAGKCITSDDCPDGCTCAVYTERCEADNF